MSWAKYSGFHFATKVGFAPASVTTDANGSSVDRLTYSHLLATANVKVTGGTGNVTITVQDSATGSSGWADYTPDVLFASNLASVTTASFPVISTDGAYKLDVDLSAAKRYIRFAVLAGSSPTITTSVVALLDQYDRSDAPGATA